MSFPDTNKDEEINLTEGIHDEKNKTVTLKIKCKYCGRDRGTLVLNYVSMKDQGFFRAACICEYCLVANKIKDKLKLK